MMRIRMIRITWVVGITLAASGFLRGGDPGPRTGRTWFGTILNLELRKHAPAERLVTNPEEFEKLWKAWKPADLVPPFDFDKNVLIVWTDGSRKIDRFTLKRDGTGNLSAAPGFSDHKDFPGFTFGMVEVPRAGIKSVEGKELKNVR